ncbi:MAG: 3-phosphoshikimate 1-carboxyvinyltransferase, partial [Luteibaculaceae bacterium]
SLLLIGPCLAKGLEIHFDSEPVSKPYINMTMDTMRLFGAKVTWVENGVKVEPGGYATGKIEVESCWSSISYFLGLVALAKKGEELRFKGFQALSSQGDAVLQSIMPHFGVKMDFQNGELRVVNTGEVAGFSEPVNCEGFPDLAQTLIALACFKGVKMHLTGLQTLRIKETDRIEAMVQELGKIGYLIECTQDSMHYAGEKTENRNPEIETYHDHRVAMSCAMGISVLDYLVIENPSVVEKSFPNFFDQLGQITGIQVLVC